MIAISTSVVSMSWTGVGGTCKGTPVPAAIMVQASLRAGEGSTVPAWRTCVPGSPAAPLDLIATYTPFQKLLKMAGLR